MKTNKIYLMTLALIFSVYSFESMAQMIYWTLPENYVNMNSLAVTPVAGGLGTAYTAANGAYDYNGNLMFYVKTEQAGVSIIDPSGTSIILNPLVYAGQQATFPLQEIAIVPVPQTCRQYYVIWIGSAPVLSGVALGYAIIDCNSGVSVATNTTHISSWGANSGGIAVTKAPSGIHYLLVAERDKLVRYSITASGISNSLVLANDLMVSCFNFPGVEPFELEVSPDGQKVLMADWITTAGTSNVYELWFSPDVYNSAPSVTQATYTYPNTNTFGFGIEYNDNASRLFVAANNGLYWANTSMSGGSLTSISSSSAYNQSHLEYGLTGVIYAVDNSGNLGKIDNVNGGVPTVTSAGIGATILSSGNSYPVGVPIFSLPDQIDGENYTYFFTPPPPGVGFTVNNTNVFPTVPLDICITIPIIMNTIPTTATQYQVSIYNSTSTGGQGVLVTSTGWVQNQPPASIDLQNLPGSPFNGTWLSNPNNTGYYLVVLEVKDDCSLPATISGLLNILNVTSEFTIPSGCLSPGQIVNFSANQPPGPDVTYSWIFQLGSPSSGTNQFETVSWSATGGYNVTLTVNHVTGCNSTTTHTITIEDTERCCDENFSWNTNTYTASPITDTWDPGTNPFGTSAIVYIKDALIIPQGSNIAINNMTFHFGLSGRVIIEKGGILTLNGSIFTGNNICQTMWIGVTVEGDVGNSNFSAQGRFEMYKLGSTPSQLENAMVGVANFNFLPIDYSTFGGYFNLSNSLIINCYRGVYKYQQDNTNNQSIINNCTFNGSYSLLYPLSGDRTNTFVFLDNNFNSSVQFFGINHFDNAESGIEAYDSKFNINGAFFINCKRGILSNKIDPGFVSNHSFTSNFFQTFTTAMQINGGMYDVIVDNNFNIGSTLNSQLTSFEGIRLESSGGFDIRDNRFHHLRYGITVYDSGLLGGSITTNGSPDGNHFFECWRGIQTFKDNSRLMIKCNTFENNQIAGGFPTWYSAAWAIFGPLADQGNNFGGPYDPVSNQFIKPASRVDIFSIADLNGGGINFSYYHYSTASNSDPQGRPLQNSMATVNVTNTQLIRQPDACDGTNLIGNGPYDPVTAMVEIDNEPNDAIREMMINRLVTWYISQDQLEDAITYLEERGEPGARERLLALYVQNGAITEAQDLINEIETSGCMDPECIDFVSLNSILINWQENDISPFEMTETEQEIIQTIADHETRVAIQAQAVMTYVFGFEYQPEVIDTGGYRTMELPMKYNTQNETYSISPNPVQDEILISFDAALTEDAELLITDYTGKLIYNVQLKKDAIEAILDLSNLASGIYTIQLIRNNISLNPKRFTKL